MTTVVMTLVRAASAADITATAPDDVRVEDLGMLYDAHFRPVRGSLVGERRDTPLGSTQRLFREANSEDEIAANASIWGIGEASASKSSGVHFAYFRAIEEMSKSSLTPAGDQGAVPEGAVWFLKAIYFGHMYEMNFSGASTSVQGALKAALPTASSGLDAWAQSNGVEYSIRTVGLSPKDGSALFARTDEEIEAAYSAVGEDRPILVVYERIPTELLPVVALHADGPVPLHLVWHE